MMKVEQGCADRPHLAGTSEERERCLISILLHRDSPCNGPGLWLAVWDGAVLSTSDHPSVLDEIPLLALPPHKTKRRCIPQ